MTSTFRRFSIPFWGSHSRPASASLTTTLSFQEHAEETEVATSLIAGGLYNASSCAIGASSRSLSKYPSAKHQTHTPSNDIAMKDGTSTPHVEQTLRRMESLASTQQEEIESSQEQSQSSQGSRRLRRTLSNISNASTVLIDPSLEQCEEKLDKQGIKHFDYGSLPPLSIIPELFDQYEGIAEFEYKLNQRPRAHPISGKVLRRLLNCGWVTMQEVQQRCADMDMDELRRYDQEGVYPYNLRFPSDPPLDKPKRLYVMCCKRWLYQRVDKGLDELRKEREWSESRGVKPEAKTLHERWIDDQQRRARVKAANVKSKRRFDGEEGGSEKDRGLGSPKRVRTGHTPSPSPAPQDTQKPKSRRRSPKVWSDEYWLNFQREHGIVIIGPDKQYPAPRSAYDPELYPEAAAEAHESQGRPPFERPAQGFVDMLHKLPERSDTPPLDDCESSQSQSQSSQSQSQSQQQSSKPRQPVPLVHPKKVNKGLQRGGLSRQQTLMEF